MFNLTEYRSKADRLTDLLPWAALIAEGVILNKDGSMQKTLCFRGPDLASCTEPQLVAATARLNNALKRLGSGWSLFIEARRQQAQAYPANNAFPDKVSLLIDEERRQLFQQEQENYESCYYLTFQYLAPRESVSKVSGWFISGRHKATHADYRKNLVFFQTTVTRIFDILRDFMFEVKPLSDEETLTYLHNCISDKSHRVRVPDTPAYLDAILADAPLVGGLEPKLGKYFIKTISIMGFPSVSVPAILDQLNYLPMEYRWVTRYLPLDKVDAEKILKTYRRQWFAKRKGLLSLVSEVFSKAESPMVDSAALRKSQDVDFALQELAEDYVSFGYYTATVTVWDEDPEVVYSKQREVERVINGLGFVTVSEQINAIDAWLSSLPGHVYANVRMPLMHSLNLSHLIPFSAVWAGPSRNEYLNDAALLYARTTGNTPFRLSTHVGDVGHQMIVGPTGSGKSVLLNLMALQFLRYPQAQVFIFDKGESALAATYGVGGQHYQVGTNTRAGLVFQPLAHIDQHDERVWAADWVAGLLLNEGISLTPEVKDAVWQALVNLANVPQVQRTLTGLRALIQDTTLRQALDAYVVGGPYGDLLDADQEVFYEKDWQCFEMEHLMQQPDVIAPVLNYIFHVLQKRFTGRPTLLVLDEAWLFLDHPLFSNKIKEWLKTLRKANVAVIFATQTVDDLLRSKVASSLLESCPSRIFLPNDRAFEPNIRETYEQLGLNDRQIHIISHSIPKRQYYYQSQRGNALFELSLGKIALAFCGTSSPDLRRQIKAVYQQVGAKRFAEAYLHSLGLEEAAAFLAQETV